MSSILASLDMSLDDIISKKKTNPDARPAKASGGGRGGRDNNASSAGPVRNRRNRGRRGDTPYSRGGADGDDLMDVDEDDAPASKRGPAAKRKAVVVKTQQKGGKKGGVSILARLGKASGGGDAGNAGTKILVKNLKFDILEDDVRELFSTVGQVSKAEIVYDRSGRSKGLARVWFSKRSDAEKAIKQYDGRTLDGQPMSITLDTEKNVRNGVFGTALGKSDEDVKFKVNLGDKRDSRDSRDSRGPRDGRDGRDGRDSRDSRGRGGRGRREGGGGRGGRSNGGGSKSAEDLDNEMDSYMKDA